MDTAGESDTQTATRTPPPACGRRSRRTDLAGTSLSVSRLPVPNLWYGWSGLANQRLSWTSRHMSDCKFFAFSESMARSSRNVADSVKRGHVKNCAKRSSASGRCGGVTSK
eukprot:94207-Pleurochrysis_carterae.AAC.1